MRIADAKELKIVSSIVGGTGRRVLAFRRSVLCTNAHEWVAAARPSAEHLPTVPTIQRRRRQRQRVHQTRLFFFLFYLILLFSNDFFSTRFSVVSPVPFTCCNYHVRVYRYTYTEIVLFDTRSPTPSLI